MRRDVAALLIHDDRLYLWNIYYVYADVETRWWTWAETWQSVNWGCTAKRLKRHNCVFWPSVFQITRRHSVWPSPEPPASEVTLSVRPPMFPDTSTVGDNLSRETDKKRWDEIIWWKLKIRWKYFVSVQQKSWLIKMCLGAVISEPQSQKQPPQLDPSGKKCQTSAQTA